MMSLATLFIDMDAYFASVEQQLRPECRGRPIAVAAVMTDTSCCIAASYEAKAFGVKTGTGVGEAKRMCRGLRIVEARPAVYVEFHHAIRAAVERCLHVEAVHSIDEFSGRLLGDERRPENAVRMARQVKERIQGEVGRHLRCSVGLAPNRLLAKVAAEMEKPDGLVAITRDELPRRLYRLKLDDLPGIGLRMLGRLDRHGVRTVEQLCALSEKQLVSIWHSVIGQLWYQWLRGEDVEDRPTHRRTVGHSHVLPPKFRNDQASRAVLIHLIHKAAMRLRRIGYWAQRLTVQVDFVNHTAWHCHEKLGLCQDTLTMLEVFEGLWRQKPPGVPLRVGMTLNGLVADGDATLPLFPEEQHRVRLCHAMDRLNAKFGRHTVYPGSMHDVLDSAPMRISFTNIPDPD